MKVGKKLSILSVLLISQFTYAQQSQQSLPACPFPTYSLPKGWYVEGGGGYTRLTGKTYPGSTTVKTSPPGWYATVGRKFSPYLAVEGSYFGYSNTSIKNSESITAAQDKHRSIDVNGKLILPFKSSGLEAFGKLGLAWLNSKIININSQAAAVNNMTFNTGNYTALGPFLGVGAQYYATPNISAILQFTEAIGNSNTGNLSFISLGASLLIN